MLKVDLHIHTRFSHDCATDLDKLVDRCQKVGLNCIAVTDHNTIQGALAVRDMAPFTVIIGEEVKTTMGEVTGLFLQQEVPQGLSPVETARLIKEQGGLVSIPHPFDPVRSSVLKQQGLDDVLPYADIVEGFNARNARGKDNVRAHQFAMEHGLLVSSVSDAHTLMEIGRSYVEMPEFDGTAQDFKRALVHGNIVGHKSSILVHLATTFNRVVNLFVRGYR